jgi:two-component system, chemotaxis family, response regulator PixG
MMTPFDLVRLLQETANSSRSGELQVRHNGVTWTLYLMGTELYDASHSLQTLDTLEQFIQQFGFESALPLRQKLPDVSSTLLIYEAIAQLRQHNCLSSAQASQLSTALTEEALESLLWLPQGEHSWQDQAMPYSLQSNGLAWPLILERLAQRRETWKSLAPIITSPYECPRCDNLAQLHQSVSHGMLPGSTLEMMAKLMQGINLRQLAFLLRQDVLKLCQLLYPYINYGVLRLEPAPAPYNALPPIPRVAPTTVNRDTYSSSYGRDTYSRDTVSRDSVAYSRDSVAVRLNPTTATITPKTYKVVCIDDSPTVLESIQRYLGTDRFEVATVEDPMASLSALFDMKPDLILMDVSMPGIDGNRLCQILKRSSVFTHVPIIMVSGNTGLLDKEKARAAGATDYLTKPFSREELLALVEQHLAIVKV